MNRKQIASWCLFDFANSSYSAVIAAVVFPVYYAGTVVGNTTGEGDVWWGRAISLSMLVTALSSPFLGGLADHAGLRKRLLILYTLLCTVSVASFSLLRPGDIVAGFLVIVLANIGMEGGLVFYNAFLPLIAPPAYQGRVSSWGFGTGYAGSIISLLIALPLVKSGLFGAAWLMTAGFFALFSLPAFLHLPVDVRSGRPLAGSAVHGARRAWDTLREIVKNKGSRTFLVAYLFYEDGVNTVIVFSSIYAAMTLHFGAAELVGLYLLVQVAALAGAFVMARPTDAWGPRRVVLMSLCLWTAVAVTAYFVQNREQFWGIACIAGLGLGTVQAASRAFFAQFIPPGREAEYFGVYALVGKSSAILGPLLFGFISSSAGSQRPAILSIAVFFIAGFLVLRMVRGGGPSHPPRHHPVAS